MVMMMKVSAELAPYFPNVEIIELHHNHKYDAPSGTSILTAGFVKSTITSGLLVSRTSSMEAFIVIPNCSMPATEPTS
ncbi:Dihydrodipicolinate reductase, partial [human gut metagenome]